MKTRYQPIKFRSILNNQCILLKSFCNELGQKLFSVGSTREDTKCYCDYEKGFLYITKPSHPCFCVPAEEDCSCYNECTGRKKVRNVPVLEYFCQKEVIKVKSKSSCLLHLFFFPQQNRLS